MTPGWDDAISPATLVMRGVPDGSAAFGSSQGNVAEQARLYVEINCARIRLRKGRCRRV